MNSNRDKIRILQNYFRNYPNETHKYKANSLTVLDPSYVSRRNLQKKNLLSDHDQLFADIQWLYVSYANLRRYIPPMYSGVYLAQSNVRTMQDKIWRLYSNFIKPMITWLDMIDTNEFINIFSGFREYSLMDNFKKDLQAYYDSRQVKAPYDILDVLKDKCAFLSIKPDITYLSKINSQIERLRDSIQNIKTLYETRVVNYAFIHEGEAFVDFANILHNIDYMMFGNISQVHYWVWNENLVYDFLLDFNEYTIKEVDRNYYRHSDNVQSAFVAFIRDLQLFRFRMKQYFDIISDPAYENNETELVQKENELLQEILQEDVVHGYLQGSISYKFSAKPMPIDKINFKEITVHMSHLEILYMYKDDTTTQENKDKIKKMFDGAISFMESQGLNSILYKSISKIVIVNASDIQTPAFIDSVDGFYSKILRTLYVYLGPIHLDSYFRIKDMERECISIDEYNSLSEVEKSEYRKYNIHVLLHEIGHHIHGLMPRNARKVWIDQVWTFDTAQKKEVHLDANNKHVSNYALTNSDEDFADTFALALQKLTTPSSRDAIKRLEKTLSQAIKDGFDVQPYSDDDDLNELVRIVDFNIISKYLGIHTIMLNSMFSFSKKVNSPHSAYLGKLDDFANFTFHPAAGYYDKKVLPIGFIEIDSPFFLNKISGKFVILLGYIINVLLLEFTKIKGMDFVIGRLETNGISIDHVSPFQQVIEKASLQLAQEIYAWTKNRDTLDPTHRDLLKEILSEFIN